MALSSALLQQPLAIPTVGGFLGSCHFKGNVFLPESRSTKVSLFDSSHFCEMLHVNGLSSDSPHKFGACKGLWMDLKGSMKLVSCVGENGTGRTLCFLALLIADRTLCFQSIGAFDHYIVPAKRSKRSHIGRELRNLNKSLRQITARSDIVRSGTPDVAYPFPEASFGPKARGICFYSVTAVVAIFIIVLMVVSHPFVLLFDRYRRRAHYFLAKIWATLTIIPFLKVKFEGLEHLPRSDTPAVYVSNHQSFLDIYTLLTLGRSFKFISKTSIFLYPVIGWAMFLMGAIPLKRMDSRSQLDCLKRCMDLIRRGASVFFFPEGTRSKDGKLGAFKKGAFSVAAKTQVPVVPMTIIGTGSIMPAGKEGILNSGSVKVVIHPCLMGDDAQVLCDQARSVIADSLDQKG